MIATWKFWCNYTTKSGYCVDVLLHNDSRAIIHRHCFVFSIADRKKHHLRHIEFVKFFFFFDKPLVVTSYSSPPLRYIFKCNKRTKIWFSKKNKKNENNTKCYSSTFFFFSLHFFRFFCIFFLFISVEVPYLENKKN